MLSLPSPDVPISRSFIHRPSCTSACHRLTYLYPSTHYPYLLLRCLFICLLIPCPAIPECASFWCPLHPVLEPSDLICPMHSVSTAPHPSCLYYCCSREHYIPLPFIFYPTDPIIRCLDCNACYPSYSSMRLTSTANMALPHIHSSHLRGKTCHLPLSIAYFILCVPHTILFITILCALQYYILHLNMMSLNSLNHNSPSIPVRFCMI
jgi:hypothetical protein